MRGGGVAGEQVCRQGRVAPVGLRSDLLARACFKWALWRDL